MQVCAVRRLQGCHAPHRPCRHDHGRRGAFQRGLFSPVSGVFGLGGLPAHLRLPASASGRGRGTRIHYISDVARRAMTPSASGRGRGTRIHSTRRPFCPPCARPAGRGRIAPLAAARPEGPCALGPVPRDPCQLASRAGHACGRNLRPRQVYGALPPRLPRPWSCRLASGAACAACPPLPHLGRRMAWHPCPQP